MSESASGTAGNGSREPRRGLLAWCFYDWANSAFPTVITTFVFSAYFTKAVADSDVRGTELWGYAVSISAVLVAIAAPVLGAVADKGGRRKPWLAAFTLLTAVPCAFLWTIEPDAAFVLPALVLLGIANFGFETAMVFYNAMLPNLSPPSRIGRWSGWGWGIGYAGGLACLAASLALFVQTDEPLFGLDPDRGEHVRATAVLVAAWMLVFSAPLFLLTPDRPRAMAIGPAIRGGLATLKHTASHLRNYRIVLRFLIARMLYTDGLNTLFAFGGIYAAGTFGFSFQELILFGIAINVTSGIGAAVFGIVDDRIGPKATVLIALVCLSFLGGALLVVDSKLMFWVFGMPLGIFFGPAQAASRSYMARLAPEELRTEFFGLYALSGKATAFIGPAVLGFATGAFDSQRAGMATILAFFLVGGALLATMPKVVKQGG